MMKNIYRIFPLFFLGLFFNQCGIEEVAPYPEDFKKFVYQNLKLNYLWRQDVLSVNLDEFNSADDLLAGLRHDKDRWTYIDDRQEYETYFETGQYGGYGFSWGFDSDGLLRIKFVYENSPAMEHGFERGAKILKVNGENIIPGIYPDLGPREIGVSNTFQLAFGDSLITEEFSIVKREIIPNNVIHKEVIDIRNEKVGYMVLLGFIESTNKEIEETFEYFSSQNVQNIILDLRYNGGGRINVAILLANYLAPQNLKNKPLMQIVYNLAFRERDYEIVFAPIADQIEPKKVVFITSGGTASASELIINGLTPWMETQSVGRQTYGKPVGSHPYEYGDKILSLISFRTANGIGEGEYFEGLPVDFESDENFDVPFGHPGDILLSAARSYLENGDYSAVSSGRLIANPYPAKVYKGINFEIGAE